MATNCSKSKKIMIDIHRSPHYSREAQRSNFTLKQIATLSLAMTVLKKSIQLNLISTHFNSALTGRDGAPA